MKGQIRINCPISVGRRMFSGTEHYDGYLAVCYEIDWSRCVTVDWALTESEKCNAAGMAAIGTMSRAPRSGRPAERESY